MLTWVANMDMWSWEGNLYVIDQLDKALWVKKRLGGPENGVLKS
jgi:hypothetical protein